MNITYTFDIYNFLLPYLEAAMGQYPESSLQVVSKTQSNASDKVRVLVACSGPAQLFELGFWTERIREARQHQHYDLADTSKLEVEVPAAFQLICKFYQVDPAATLTLFAGDLSRHPFITGGSDERIMAMEYFKRGHFAGDQEERAEDLFDALDSLRRSWPGNFKMEEYKKTYPKALRKLDKEFNKKG